MKLNRKAILKYGWSYDKPSTAQLIDEVLPLRAETKFLQIWPRLSAGMRWILLDLLRRFLADIEKHSDDLSHAPGWARLRLVDPCGILTSSSGDFMLRLMLPNKSRKTPPFVKLTFVNDDKGFSCWPVDLMPEMSKEEAVSISKLGRTPIITSPDQALRQRVKDDWDMDDIACAVTARIPEDVRDEVLRAIICHRLTFHTTNATGEAGAVNPPVMGIMARREKGRDRIVPVGHLTESIYFQNGWLMVKLAKLPMALRARIENAEKTEDTFDVVMHDGGGGVIRPFEGVVADRSVKGNTWMGDHIRLRFAKTHN